ncbi:MAG: SDR family NAD(P)-dependent oxidoreductase [Terriglobales bacterium]
MTRQEQTILMKLTGNTILITGGGSGIGRGLAEAFHALGNQVIIAGRRKHALDATTAANPGMVSLEFDIVEPANIRSFAAEVTTRFSTLNVLINNAGIMRVENLKDQPADLADAEAVVATNLLGPIRLTAALLPLLRSQPYSVIMNVTSGLAFVPMAKTPTYCATKAAIHSYTQSLRFQLRGTTTEVLELIPPYVATDLLDGAGDPRAMPPGKFIAEAMEILKTQPAAIEICVESVKRLCFAAESGRYDAIFQGLNEAMASSSH